MPVDVTAWRKTWEVCPWATAFTSPLWQAVIKSIESRDETFEWETIITPLSRIRLAQGLLRGFESSVPGVPAGPIAQKKPEEALVDAYWKELEKRTRGRFLIHLRPDSPFTRTSFRKIITASYVLDIKDRERKLRPHHRRLIKKAQASGIRVTPARRESDFEAYNEAYEESIKRWRKKPSRIYPPRFFDAVREYLLRADTAGFFMAYKDEIPQAGALVLYEPSRAIYWHGASIADPEPGSAHFLHYQIMNHLAKRGVSIYDFGPSAGLEGVERFKQGFGASVENILTVLGPRKVFSSYFLRRRRR
ncbi:GNAT family N-acetyltransferase [candidate division WOR-3 bacterium]|nr:GNAT family N-acetyltransferase [candidate division WOR-3 bacterium]